MRILSFNTLVQTSMCLHINLDVNVLGVGFFGDGVDSSQAHGV